MENGKAAKRVNAAIMGIGTVGGGTYDILVKNAEAIKRTQGLDIRVVKILDRSKELIDKRAGKTGLAVTDLNDITSDDSISIVVETMGGVEPAKTFIKKVLAAGKSVVTANKELISKHWPELERAARESGAGLYFEASCVGGVPVIRTLTQSMQGDNIVELMGIINGTTNYILTKMTREGMSYADALAGAQKAGFAEADPTADVEGYDAMYKLSILASLAFHTSVPYTGIYREGITRVTPDDIRRGKELGYTLKLLGIGRRNGDEIEVRVHPAFVPDGHPLAGVSNEFNAVFLKGDFADDIMLYGRGAGAYPTGSAIVSDIVTCAQSVAHRYADFENNGSVNPPSVIRTDFHSKYYIALSVSDKPGVLAKITEILGRLGISVSAFIQHEAAGGNAPIIFMTHKTSENAVRSALGQIGKLAEVTGVDTLIRVI
jgi:homoserine dehydrogenase